MLFYVDKDVSIGRLYQGLRGSFKDGLTTNASTLEVENLGIV